MRLSLVRMICILLLIVLTVVLVILGIRNAFFRTILIVPVILILFGYTLTAGIFPEHVNDTSERLTLALGVGFSTIIVSGILFSWLRISFSISSWPILLGGLVLTAIIVALVRRWEGFRSITVRIYPRFSLGDSIMFGLAALILVGAIQLARIGAVQQTFTGFTQLWMLPVAQDDQRFVQLGVYNGESEKISYKLQLYVGNQMVAVWEPITLGPEESWQTTNVLPEEMHARQAGAQLFRLDDLNKTYRYVHLWFDNQEVRYNVPNFNGYRPISADIGWVSASDTVAMPAIGEP